MRLAFLGVDSSVTEVEAEEVEGEDDVLVAGLEWVVDVDVNVGIGKVIVEDDKDSIMYSAVEDMEADSDVEEKASDRSASDAVVVEDTGYPLCTFCC